MGTISEKKLQKNRQNKIQDENNLSKDSKENQILPIMAEVSENNIKSSNKSMDIKNSNQKILSTVHKKISKSLKIVSPKCYSSSPVKNYSDDKSKQPFNLENHTVSKEKSIPSISSKKYSRKITIDKSPNNQILLSETEKCESSNSYEKYETNSKNIKSLKSLNSSRN